MVANVTDRGPWWLGHIGAWTVRIQWHDGQVGDVIQPRFIRKNVDNWITSWCLAVMRYAEERYYPHEGMLHAVTPRQTR